MLWRFFFRFPINQIDQTNRKYGKSLATRNNHEWERKLKGEGEKERIRKKIKKKRSLFALKLDKNRFGMDDSFLIVQSFSLFQNYE